MTLHEATTDEIFEELGKRAKHVLVIMDEPLGCADRIRRWYSSDWSSALGLAEAAKHFLLNDYETKPESEDDE